MQHRPKWLARPILQRVAKACRQRQAKTDDCLQRQNPAYSSGRTFFNHFIQWYGVIFFMIQNLMLAFLIILAATGAVLLLMIFLQRLIRPEQGAYTLYVHLNADDLQNEARIGYAVQRIRFFGEENCTDVLVCCESLSSQECACLQKAFSMYEFVRFIGLDCENQAENMNSVK